MPTYPFARSERKSNRTVKSRIRRDVSEGGRGKGAASWSCDSAARSNRFSPSPETIEEASRRPRRSRVKRTTIRPASPLDDVCVAPARRGGWLAGRCFPG